jgi:hypothetical protein
MAVESSLTTPETDPSIPVWLILVGPPSSGKTSMVNNLLGTDEKKNPNVCAVSTMTSGALASGHKDHQGNKAESLLPRLNGKCFLMGEMSALLSQRSEVVQQFLGDLCEIFDGDYNKWTGTVGVLSIKSRFSLLGCITPMALRQHREYMNRIGARFLMYELPPLTPEEEDLGFDLKNAPQVDQAQAKKTLRALVAQQLDAVRQIDTPAELTPAGSRLVKSMAQLVARGRGSVLHNEHQTESAYRIYTQLMNLTRSLARVSGHAVVDASDLELVRCVALSTVTAPRGKILQVCSAESQGATTAQVADAIGCQDKAAEGYLQDMATLGLLTKTPLRTGKRGRPSYLWAATPAVQPLLQPIEEL